MKVRNPGIHLVHAKKSLHRSERPEQDTALSWEGRIRRVRKQSMLKRAPQSNLCYPEDRAARVEELRVQIQAGMYRVESAALAEKMLGLNQGFGSEDTIDVQRLLTEE